MKILLVEDDREAADYLEKAFAEAGHNAHVAGDGDTGFALADSGEYDVMVVDRMCPRRRAFGHCRTPLPRQHDAGPDTFGTR